MVLWLRYLTEIKDGTTEISAEFHEEQDLRQAIDCLRESLFSASELASYDRYWDRVCVERTVIEDAVELGGELGLKKGFKQGEESGILKERFSIANRLKQLGASVKEISSITGLTEEEIDRI